MAEPLAVPSLAAREVGIDALARALEASWDERTAYLGAVQVGNPAHCQCYPTSRVVQWFYPDYEIARGEVWTGKTTETHFWNVRAGDPESCKIDLSWSQFPEGSEVRGFEVLDKKSLGDSPGTVARVDLLLSRVLARLEGKLSN